MIRDRGPDFTAAFDAVLADAGVRTVLCNVRTPRMNAIIERWIGGCRRELHNQHRPHRSLDAAAPLKPLPEPVDLDRYRVRRQTHTGCLINEYRLVA
ncbi:MAG: hypothetical protein ACLP8X_18015 [Streptosporangiaceae bacterium]